MKYKRIKDLREDHDLTQAQIAEKLGLYTTTYQRYERGEREIPFDIVILLAKEYQVSIDYIAELIHEPKTPNGEPYQINKKTTIIQKGNGNKINFRG